MDTADLRAEAIRRDGYVVVQGLLTPSEVAEIKQALAPWLEGRLMGRNDDFTQHNGATEVIPGSHTWDLDQQAAPGDPALAVPPEIARGYSERIQELCGYDIYEPTFIGYVDGMHPKRLLDPSYAARKPKMKWGLPGV